MRMGRIPTVNLNLPPRMRKRVQRSGKTYYYLRTMGADRKEMPLGDDFIIALRRYSELSETAPAPASPLFSDVILKYRLESLLKLSDATQRTQKSDIKHVEAFFKDAPLDQIKPMHISQFLQKHADKPTTANRCKRLFSAMWNDARGWGYTDLENPCKGIAGFPLGKRTTYITDTVFDRVHEHASPALQDALDLAYLTGQRPGDALTMSVHDIVEGCLIVTQIKTKQPLRITIEGKLKEVLARIAQRKIAQQAMTSALLIGSGTKRLTKITLRRHFIEARKLAADKNPAMAKDILAMWFYDLRAKAADDTADARGEQAASNLLGHDSVKTTQRHYLRRGKTVSPTK